MIKNEKKRSKKGTKKSTQPRKNVRFCLKKRYFFTQKDLPAPQKTEILHDKKWHKKFQKRYQKEHLAPHMFQIWSFAWKIENRHTNWDFEKKILAPNFTKFLNPYENFSALFYLNSNLS